MALEEAILSWASRLKRGTSDDPNKSQAELFVLYKGMRSGGTVFVRPGVAARDASSQERQIGVLLLEELAESRCRMTSKTGQDPTWCPDGWERHTYSHGNHFHAFYVIDPERQGVASPSVLLLHEFPGIMMDLTQLANTLAQDFRVVVPSIFGRDGAAKPVDSLKQICVRREVHLLALHKVSASVGWLRDFADQHVARGRKESYGVIGMCFTGNFALALAVDPRVRAAVVAQPSIPLWPSSLGLSPKDRGALTTRTDLLVQGYRFRRDCLSPGAKLMAAEGLLGPERMLVFPLGGRNERKHSTLTRDRDENAVEGVRLFLRERLFGQEPSA